MNRKSNTKAKTMLSTTKTVFTISLKKEIQIASTPHAFITQQPLIKKQPAKRSRFLSLPMRCMTPTPPNACICMKPSYAYTQSHPKKKKQPHAHAYETPANLMSSILNTYHNNTVDHNNHNEETNHNHRTHHNNNDHDDDDATPHTLQLWWRGTP